MLRVFKASVFGIAVAVLACVPQLVQGAAPADRAPNWNFVSTGALDFGTLVPPPPAPGSAEDRSDMDAVLKAQRTRTADQMRWAQRIALNDLFVFSDILGEWFQKDRIPMTAALLKDVNDDLDTGTGVAKRLFKRPRPFMANAEVQPCVKRLNEFSYPSGHTMSFFVEAAVLAELFPEKRGELFAFADKMAWGRVIGGVHYPSDLAAGKIIAAKIVLDLDGNPSFSARLEACRQEIAPFTAIKDKAHTLAVAARAN